MGWKVGIIINSNLVFDYLACYRPLVCEVVFKEGQLENINDALSAKTWGVLSAGTCSPTHKKRLGIEKIGHVDLTDKMELVVAQFEPQSRQGVSEVLKNDGIDKAVSDISIASWLNGTLGCIKTINSLEEIGIKAPH